MKPLVVCVCVVVLLDVAVAGDADVKALEKKAVKMLQDIAGTFSTIKDKASAQAAVAKLNKLLQQRKVLEKEFKSLPADKLEAMKKPDGALAKAFKEVVEQAQRLEKLSATDAGIKAVLEESTVFKEGFGLHAQTEKSKVDAARLQAKQLLKGAQAYFIVHGVWPTTLQDLLKADASTSGPILKDKQSLLDPWGNPYQYDPTGSKSKTKDADIWAVAPNGQIIGSWVEKKKE